MKAKVRKHYSSYRSNSQEEIDDIIEKFPHSKERRYMKSLVSPSKNYLIKQGINIRQDFISTLQKYGYKSSHITTLYVSFADFLNIDWLNKRTFLKANFQEKNVVINRIVIQYESQFIDFIQNHLPSSLPSFEDQGALIQEFRDKIQFAKQQTEQIQILQSDFSNDNLNAFISEFEPNQYENDVNDDDDSFLLGNMLFQD